MDESDRIGAGMMRVGKYCGDDEKCFNNQTELLSIYTFNRVVARCAGRKVDDEIFKPGNINQVQNVMGLVPSITRVVINPDIMQCMIDEFEEYKEHF